MKSSIIILLVEPENAGNVGSVARAMKNMGLNQLYLVNPVQEWKRNSKMMAVGAYDIIEKAKVFTSVEKAVKKLHFVVGTTRRKGPRRGPFLEFDESIKKIKSLHKKHKIAVMFGRESKGLDNTSLNYCDWMMSIPVSPLYPSINLAQAVMIVAYSLFDHSTKLPKSPPRRGRTTKKKGLREKSEMPIYLDKKNVSITLGHFETALRALGYQRRNNQTLERILNTLNRLFKRGGLLESEAQMFKGISRQIREKTIPQKK